MATNTKHRERRSMAETPASAGDNGADAAPATPHTVIHPFNLSILSPVHTATYYLPKNIQYILVFLFNFYLPFVFYLVFLYYNIVPYPIAIRILRISWKTCIVRVCKVNIYTNTFFYRIGKQSRTEWFTRITSRV